MELGGWVLLVLPGGLLDGQILPLLTIALVCLRVAQHRL